MISRKAATVFGHATPPPRGLLATRQTPRMGYCLQPGGQVCGALVLIGHSRDWTSTQLTMQNPGGVARYAKPVRSHLTDLLTGRPIDWGVRHCILTAWRSVPPPTCGSGAVLLFIPRVFKRGHVGFFAVARITWGFGEAMTDSLPSRGTQVLGTSTSHISDIEIKAHPFGSSHSPRGVFTVLEAEYRARNRPPVGRSADQTEAPPRAGAGV